MREATDRSGLLDSETTKTYESMFDQQLSTELSANGTFGIAQALQNQIKAQRRKPKAAPYPCLNPQDMSFAKTMGPMNYSVWEG